MPCAWFLVNHEIEQTRSSLSQRSAARLRHVQSGRRESMGFSVHRPLIPLQLSQKFSDVPADFIANATKDLSLLFRWSFDFFRISLAPVNDIAGEGPQDRKSTRL